MGVILRKHQGEMHLTKISKLSLVGVLVALSSSFIITIWAVYLDSFFHSISIVGLVSSMLTLIGIATYFISIPIIEKNNKAKIFTYTLLVYAIAYLAFIITKNVWLFLLVAVITTITGTLRVTSFGLIIKDSSSKTKLSRNEGLIYTVLNLAFVVGPLAAGYILSEHGSSFVFALASMFIFLAFLMFKFESLNDPTKTKKIDKNLIKNFFAFFKKKERVYAYIIGGGVSFWWSLAYLFMPLYIVRNGLSELWIGYFLFALPIPLIILEYKFSNRADKHGFKKFFKIGFIIPCIGALICFFMVENVFAVLGVLVVSSIGLAMLEPTTEAYFFKISTRKEEQRFYGPYNTRLEVAGFFGKAIPSVFLLFMPFKYIFLLFSAVMFLMFLISFKIKEVKN